MYERNIVWNGGFNILKRERGFKCTDRHVNPMLNGRFYVSKNYYKSLEWTWTFSCNDCI